jgi:hypothetical protein
MGICATKGARRGCVHAVLAVEVLVDGIGAFQVQLIPWGR